MSGGFHAPVAFPQEREPPLPIGLGGLADLIVGLDDMDMWKFFTIRGLEVRTSQEAHSVSIK
jgi:hypothetical protein